MPLYQDEGVVLRTAKLGEADRILTLLTRDHGKVRAVAKGVRRTKSRFGGRLEPFMRVALLIAEGRSLDVVSCRIDRRVCRADLRRFSSVYGGERDLRNRRQSGRHGKGACGRTIPACIGRVERACQTCARAIHDWRFVRAARTGDRWLDTPSARLRGVRRADFVHAVLVFFDSRRRPDVRRRPYPESEAVSWDAICRLSALVDGDWGSWTVFRRPRRFNGKPTK